MEEKGGELSYYDDVRLYRESDAALTAAFLPQKHGLKLGTLILAQ